MAEQLTGTQRKNHNRAIIILILALFAAIWPMINAGELFGSSIMYIIMDIIPIFLYFVWSKF